MFTFKQAYILRNEAVMLLPLHKEHEAALFEVSQEPDIWRHFEENGYGKENFRQYIHNALQKREKQEEYPFVIKDLKRNQYAGMTRVYAVDNKLKNVKVGHTWIGKSFQGTGLNRHAKYLLFEWLFEELEMERIGFGASSENIQSIKAMESVGCKQEGRLRSFLPDSHLGKRVDIVLLSILKTEWEESVKAALAQKLAVYA